MEGQTFAEVVMSKEKAERLREIEQIGLDLREMDRMGDESDTEE